MTVGLAARRGDEADPGLRPVAPALSPAICEGDPGWGGGAHLPFDRGELTYLRSGHGGVLRSLCLEPASYGSRDVTRSF